MSPEKLELLRELIRAEIAYNNIILLNLDHDGYDWSIDAKKNADQVFLEVCLRFCGTD
jgi:hypothetical protein